MLILRNLALTSGIMLKLRSPAIKKKFTCRVLFVVVDLVLVKDEGSLFEDKRILTHLHQLSLTLEGFYHY